MTTKHFFYDGLVLEIRRKMVLHCHCEFHSSFAFWLKICSDADIDHTTRSRCHEACDSNMLRVLHKLVFAPLLPPARTNTTWVSSCHDQLFHFMMVDTGKYKQSGCDSLRVFARSLSTLFLNSISYISQLVYQ